MTSSTWLGAFCGICAFCVGVSADCLSSIRVVDQFLSEAEVGILKSTRGDDLQQHEGIQQRLNEALGGSVLVKGIASSRKTADVPKHQDQWSNKRIVEGKAGVVYLESAADGGNLGSILFEDPSSKAVKEVEVVPGRLITWDNHLCLHGFRARHDGPRHTLDQQPFEEPAQLADVDAVDARDGCNPWCLKHHAFLIPGCRRCFRKYYGKYYGPSPPPTTTTGLKAAVKVTVPPTTTTNAGLKIVDDTLERLAAIPDETLAPVPVQGGAREHRRAEHGQLAPHEVDAVHFMQMPDEL